MGKSTISMAIFNSYVKLAEGTSLYAPIIWEAETCVLQGSVHALIFVYVCSLLWW